MKNGIRIVVILLIVSLLALKNCTKSTPIQQTKLPDNTPTATTQATTESPQNSAVPAKVYEVLKYVRANHQAPEGYVGGRHFGNFEGHLPKSDANGRKIDYQEWDVNPHLQHKNRGVERLITGSNGRAYYTNDHYNSFTEIN